MRSISFFLYGQLRIIVGVCQQFDVDSNMFCIGAFVVATNAGEVFVYLFRTIVVNIVASDAVQFCQCTLKSSTELRNDNN